MCTKQECHYAHILSGQIAQSLLLESKSFILRTRIRVYAHMALLCIQAAVYEHCCPLAFVKRILLTLIFGTKSLTEKRCTVQSSKTERQITERSTGTARQHTLTYLLTNPFPTIHSHVVILFYSSWEQKDSYTSYSHLSVVNIDTLKSCVRVLLCYFLSEGLIHASCFMLPHFQ